MNIRVLLNGHAATPMLSQSFIFCIIDVFNYCQRRLFDRHSAEDVTSTIFFKVMHNLGSFDGRATDFRSWLFRIATNAVNDHLRGVKRRANVVEKAVINTRAKCAFVIDCDEELLEKKAILKQALLSLKPKYQTVITLRFFENMKLTEIAACLGKNPLQCAVGSSVLL